MISSKEHLQQEKSSNSCTVPFGSPTGPMPTTQQQQEVVRNVDDYLAKKFADRKLPRKGVDRGRTTTRPEKSI